MTYKIGVEGEGLFFRNKLTRVNLTKNSELLSLVKGESL